MDKLSIYGSLSIDLNFLHISSQKWLVFANYFGLPNFLPQLPNFFTRIYPSYPWHFPTLYSESSARQAPGPQEVSQCVHLNSHLFTVNWSASSCDRPSDWARRATLYKKITRLQNRSAFLMSTFCIQEVWDGLGGEDLDQCHLFHSWTQTQSV